LKLRSVVQGLCPRQLGFERDVVCRPFLDGPAERHVVLANGCFYCCVPLRIVF